MPLNVPGILVPFQLLFRPSIVIPSFVVKGTYLYIFPRSFLTVSTQEDIRQIDFAALKQAGYRGAVFDKDNCIVRTRLFYLSSTSLSCVLLVDVTAQG
jgi:phosphatidylglycerophosphatase GEP4